MNWTIREGRIDEIEYLVTLRRAMFEGMGYDDLEMLDRICDACRAYFAQEMETGEFRVWVACVSGADAVGAGDTVDSGGADAYCDSIPSQAGPCGGIGACDGELIASIGLVVHSVPPGPSNLAGKVGYVMNLVTLPTWRRQGIARALLEHVLGVLRAEAVPVATLHASQGGRSLYEQLGFRVREEVPELFLHLA